MSLHRAVMTVLKLTDDLRSQEEKRRAEEQEILQSAADPVVSEQLQKLIAAADFIRHVYLVSATGRMIGEAHVSRALQDPAVDLRPMMLRLAGSYPRPNFKRAFFEDDGGIMALLHTAQDHLLIAVAEKGSSLGAVALGTGKLVAQVDTLLPDRKPAAPAELQGVVRSTPRLNTGV